MNVFQYVDLRKKELDAFAKDWEENRDEEPNDWPETMGDGDWYQQELAFNEIRAVDGKDG